MNTRSPAKTQLERRGGVNVMLVLLITIVATLIIATIQSRLLLQIARSQSLSDNLKADYAAQSQLNDILARLSYPGFSLPTGTTTLPLLADGTIITIKSQTQDNTQNLTITAKRPYAVSVIGATKVTSTTTQSALEKVEIMFALDCSWSMSSPADPKNLSLGARMHQLNLALNGVITKIQALPVTEQSKYYIGLSSFRDNAVITRDKTDGTLLTPTNDMTRVKKAVNDWFDSALRSNPNDSSETIVPRCYYGFSANTADKLTGNTNVGAGFGLVNTYYATNPAAANTRRVEVLITDGITSSMTPDPNCPAHYPLGLPNNFYCPLLKPFCTDSVIKSLGYQCATSLMNQCNGNDCSSVCNGYSYDYANCTIATTNQTYKSAVSGDGGTYHGTRDPNVDAYGVTVNTGASSYMQNNLGDHYYQLTSADKLNDALTNNIFTQITTTTSTLFIHKM